MRTVSCLSSYQASRIAYGVDKQQPLTLCEYIVLLLRIVYIRSVSVVAPDPTPYPILREFDKKDEFNNAFFVLMSYNLSEVGYKIIIKLSHKQRNSLLSANQAGGKSVCSPIMSVFSDFPTILFNNASLR